MAGSRFITGTVVRLLDCWCLNIYVIVAGLKCASVMYNERFVKLVSLASEFLVMVESRDGVNFTLCTGIRWKRSHLLTG